MAGGSFHRFVGWNGKAIEWLGLASLFLGLLLLPSLWSFAQAEACPTVVVIIPETCVIHQAPRPVPDPASETSIIHHFLDYGFHVVDQAQVKFLRMTDPEIIKRARGAISRQSASSPSGSPRTSCS